MKDMAACIRLNLRVGISIKPDVKDLSAEEALDAYTDFLLTRRPERQIARPEDVQ